MIKIFKMPKYDKTQYDKHFGIFYHMALSKYDKKKNLWITNVIYKILSVMYDNLSEMHDVSSEPFEILSKMLVIWSEMFKITSKMFEIL